MSRMAGRRTYANIRANNEWSPAVDVINEIGQKVGLGDPPFNICQMHKMQYDGAQYRQEALSA